MAKATNEIKIAEILRGCEPARIQSVGYMQVIPLVSDVTDDRFCPPGDAQIKTSHYGTLVFQNPSASEMIVPAQAAYVVKQSAQDHALPHVGLVKPKAQRSFNTAVCIQETQGGHISASKQEMVILPFALREPAHNHRTENNYGRLWPAIAEFNQSMGITGRRSHLEYFLSHFKDQLARFVAEFEPVPRQVGAIIMIGGKVVGIERAPNYDYWRNIWQPLLRECYGSLAIHEAKQHEGDEPPVPKTRVVLGKAKTLIALKKSVKDALDQEYKNVKALVNKIITGTMKASTDEKAETVSVDALENTQFVGQVVRDGDQVVYASLITKEQYRDKQDWYDADDFTM